MAYLRRYKPNRWQWLFALSLSVMLFVTIPPLWASTSTPQQDLQRLNGYIEQALTKANAKDFQGAVSAYKQFDNDWFDVEDGVKKTSRQAYRDIESAMGEVKFAFSKVPPNQSQVVAALLKLQATDQKFIADSRGEPRAETNTSNVTIASLIERLNRADAAIDKHDFADSAAEIKGFQTDWLEVEGIVKTKSKDAYVDVENNIRATEGDRVRVIFHNIAGHSHSLHFHGIHPTEMDGVVPIRHGSTKVFEFDAEPFGVHLYHCHISPVVRHIGKGLYGMFIIDPVQGRPPADEIVLVMGGYDVNEDGRNELYAFNGIPDYYLKHPIPIQQDQLIRLYLLNMTELEPALTFHIHANMFRVYRTGRTLTPNEETDAITMGIAERHILEFSYRTPGMYMFHPHQDQIAEAGCMGNFNVVSNT